MLLTQTILRLIELDVAESNSQQLTAVSIAIIGSGPAGCYVAEHLLKLLPDAAST